MQTLIGVVFTERPGEVCEGHILIGHNYCQSCRVRKNWAVTAGDITVIITTSQSPPSNTLRLHTIRLHTSCDVIKLNLRKSAFSQSDFV